MGSSQQLKRLIWKNFLLRRRKPVSNYVFLVNRFDDQFVVRILIRICLSFCFADTYISGSHLAGGNIPYSRIRKI